MSPIRSFVRRGGRVTGAQQRALAGSWPRFGIEYAPGLLDLDALFERDAPRILEIGFGNGDTLVELATRRPEADFIGIEVHPPGVGRCLLGIEAKALTNVRVIAHDAVEVLNHMIPDASLDEVLLYFPDPWPKKRHHKRRIVQPEFAALVARKLVPGSAWRLATDWAPYAQHMLEVLTAAPDFVNADPAGGFVPRPESRPETKFERRGQRLGHEVFDLEFRRR